MNDSTKPQSPNPIFDPLVECYSRTALTGLASFWFGKFIHSSKIIQLTNINGSVIVFSTSHFLQKPLRNRIGYPVAGSLIASTTLAGTITYFITKNYFEKCSKLRHEATNEIEN